MYYKEGESAAPTWLLPVDIAGAVKQLMKAAVPAESYVIYLSFFIILSLLRCLQAVVR